MLAARRKVTQLSWLKHGRETYDSVAAWTSASLLVIYRRRFSVSGCKGVNVTWTDVWHQMLCDKWTWPVRQMRLFQVSGFLLVKYLWILDCNVSMSNSSQLF